MNDHERYEDAEEQEDQHAVFDKLDILRVESPVDPVVTGEPMVPRVFF